MDPLPIDLAQASDLDAIRVLNQAAIPHVGGLDPSEVDHLHRQARALLVARNEEDLAGFVLLLDQDADYDSPNFKWFCERYPRFLYVDRLVVAAPYRRRGLATRLYEAARTWAGDDFDTLACEVNIDPPNPISMAFHRGFGFAEVGRQWAKGKQVVMMTLDLT